MTLPCLISGIAEQAHQGGRPVRAGVLYPDRHAVQDRVRQRVRQQGKKNGEPDEGQHRRPVQNQHAADQCQGQRPHADIFDLERVAQALQDHARRQRQQAPGARTRAPPAQIVAAQPEKKRAQRENKDPVRVVVVDHPLVGRDGKSRRIQRQHARREDERQPLSSRQLTMLPSCQRRRTVDPRRSYLPV